MECIPKIINVISKITLVLEIISALNLQLYSVIMLISPHRRTLKWCDMRATTVEGVASPSYVVVCGSTCKCKRGNFILYDGISGSEFQSLCIHTHMHVNELYSCGDIEIVSWTLSVAAKL